MLALSRATRDELIALLLVQQDQIEDLERHLAAREQTIAAQQAAMAELTEQVGPLPAA